MLALQGHKSIRASDERVRLGVIILNWNDSESTLSCLGSIAAQPKSANLEFRTVIVDNDSGSESINCLRRQIQEHPASPTLVRNNSNLGFARGMNQGAKALSAWEPDFYWFLNDDSLLRMGAMQAIIDFALNNPEAVVIGPSLMHRDTDIVQCAGGCFYNKWLGTAYSSLAGQLLDIAKEIPSLTAIDYVCGAAMLVNGDFYRRVRGLPEDYFMFFEELELASKLKSNELLAWCPNAEVEHGRVITATRQKVLHSQASAQAALSCLFFTKKHYPASLPSVFAVRVVGAAVLSLFRGDFRQALYFLVCAQLFFRGERQLPAL